MRVSEDKGGSIAWYARFSQLSSRTSPENPKGYLNRSPKVNLEISEEWEVRHMGKNGVVSDGEDEKS